MNRLKITFNFTLILFSLVIEGFCQDPNQIPEPFMVIPQPQKTLLLEGNGLLFDGLSTLELKGNFSRPVMGDILSQLTESNGGKGILTLKLESSVEIPDSDEGYILTILNGNVEIVSRGEAGLFYGCQTLEQLLEDARDFDTPVPACKITDYPSLKYRAVHFDVKHHLDHMNVYYESIDRLARYKINAIIFEFEDKLRYQRQPLVASPQAISIDEMAALTNYARERHIEITPLVQGLGHATFILKHEQYANLRELSYNRWAFCPLNEGTYQVLFDLYRDAIDATPGSKYLHVGGDEIGNIGLCPRCKPTADKEGMLSLNLYWLKRVCEFAEENDRIPIFWDDMPLKEAGVYETTYKNDFIKEDVAKIWEEGGKKLSQVISDFPKNCIYMRWNYSMARQPGNIEALDWYQKNGLKVMVATAAQTGATLFPYDDRDNVMSSHGIPAICSFNQIASEKGTEGMLCTAWDDDSPLFETYWHGFIASSEYSWSPYNRTLEEFDRAWMQREFATSISDYTNLYKQLRDATEFWNVAFNKNGGRNDDENALFNLPGLAHWLPPKKPGYPIINDFTYLLIDLPDLQLPGKWSENYKEKIDRATQILSIYPSTSQSLNLLYNHSKKNRYHWELFIALNEFQMTAPRLLLALKKCDTNNKAKLKAGIIEVNKALILFDNCWNNLQKVYSKTRFISYPPNYVPDRYFHFASQREDLTWMIQVEELFHKQVREWLNNLK